MVFRDVNNESVSNGDKILYVKSGYLEKGTVISIGKEHFLARRNSDSGIANIHKSIDLNKHVIKHDW